MNNALLAGASIVVTRPEERGEALCKRIAAAGGEALLFPVIDIRALPDATLPDGDPDWVIFASVAAVEHGYRRVHTRMSRNTRIAAIGTATARALQAAGRKADAVPERQESEGLLAMPALTDLNGLATWIVRGRGGRDLLPQALRERGAVVSLVEVYERALPAAATALLVERWRTNRVDAIVVSSRAGLENLHAMLDAEGRAFLRETQLVMPTERMLKLALELGIRPAPLVAAGASDDAFLAALTSWWRDADRPQDSR